MIQVFGKSVVLTDIHFGRRKFSMDTFENTMKFYNQEIFTRLDGIKNLFILGDFFDNRVVIGWGVINRVVSEFFEPLKEKGVNVYMIIGNHDMQKKDTIEFHSLKMFDILYDNVTVFEQDTFVDFNGKKLLFVPWIVDESEYDFSSFRNADMVLGHFEIVNFEMIAGVKSEHGLDSKDFNGVPVLSGHYHVKSSNRNIHYLGVSEQMNWSDFNSHKGAHILNEDLSLDFVENLVSNRYVKIYINTKSEKPISVYGLTRRKLSFNSIEDVLKKHSLKQHTIKVYLQDVSDVVKYNNFKVQLDTNNIEYLLIDETPEMQAKMNLSEDELQDDKVDIISIFKNQLSEEDFQVFSGIYTEALQDIE